MAQTTLSAKNENSKIESNWLKRLPAILLTILIVGYIAAIMAVHVINVHNFRYGFDLSFYEQAVWNTVHGRFLQVSATDFSSSLLGTDAILILALMAPFYAIVPSFYTLLFLETLVVGLSALPVYWLARERLRSRWAGLMLAITYLLIPSVSNGNLYEWRERLMAMGFLLFAFYFYQRGNFKTFMLFAALAMCCRPENGLVLAMLALYGYISGYNKKFGWRFIWGPLMVGLIWFIVVVAVVIPGSSSGGSFALAQNYGQLGASPSEILKNVVTNPVHSWQIIFTPDSTFSKLIYIPLLLLPLLFLSLGSPAVLLMTLPPLALNLLSIRPSQYDPYDYHYQGSIVPWLIIAVIFTIEKLAFGSVGAKWRERVKLQSPQLILAGLVLVTACLVYAGNTALDNKNAVREAFATNARSDAANSEALLREIPADAPLAISSLFATQVPMRQQLWLLQTEPLYSVDPLKKAEYAFVDEHTLNFKNPSLAQAAQNQYIENLLHNWQVVDSRGSYILLKRKVLALESSFATY